MDTLIPFMLEDGLFRGRFIAADETINDILEKQAYPNSVAQLIRQSVLLALALAGGLKYDGVFSLQLKGNGAISSLFTDVTHDKKTRAYAVFHSEQLPDKATKLSELFGTQAQLIFSVSQIGKEPYQGVIALTQDTLEEAILDYFRLSEQIQTSLVLKMTPTQGRCLLLQKMPDNHLLSQEEQADLWETADVLLHSVKEEELFSPALTPQEILFRLFHANKLVVFQGQKPTFSCRCYRGKMFDFLKKIPPHERDSLFENDRIQMQCQFCHETYSFDKKEFE